MVQYDRVEPVRVVLLAVDRSENLRVFFRIQSSGSFMVSFFSIHVCYEFGLLGHLNGNALDFNVFGLHAM